MLEIYPWEYKLESTNFTNMSLSAESFLHINAKLLSKCYNVNQYTTDVDNKWIISHAYYHVQHSVCVNFIDSDHFLRHLEIMSVKN